VSAHPEMLVTGVVFALGMVIAGVSVTHGATAAEAAEEVTKPQPLINRYAVGGGTPH